MSTNNFFLQGICQGLHIIRMKKGKTGLLNSIIYVNVFFSFCSQDPMKPLRIETESVQIQIVGVF